MALEVAADAESREAAQKLYERDARSAGDTSGYNLVTWTDLHEAWWEHSGRSVPVWPLTPEKFTGVGSLLKAGGYRSGYNYSSAAKDEHIARGYEWSSSLSRAHRRFNLSTQRGIGPGKQSEPLRFAAVMALTVGLLPLFAGAPIGTLNMATLFTYFVLRELEGALARRHHLTINHDAKTVTWELPVTKTDPAALGCKRTWGCTCGPGSAACPYHAACSQVDLLASRFPDRLDDPDLPLFPDDDGREVSAEVMVQVVEWLAQATGEALCTAGGTRRFGKHSWRSTGAVVLAALGLELWKIQLLARWASAQILHYARLAPLTGLTAQVRELQSSSSLGKMLEELRSSVGQLSSELASLEASTLEALRTEAHQREQLAKSLDTPADIIVNNKTRAHHKVLVMTGSPIFWITACSFHFGRVEFTVVQELSKDYKQWCDKCFYKQREEAKTRARMSRCMPV